MADTSAATVLLLTTLAVALAGAWRLATASARRAELVERGEPAVTGAERRDPLGVADRVFRRTRPGAALAESLAAAGLDRSPLDFAGLCVAVAGLGYGLASMVLTPLVSAFVACACLAGCRAWLGREREKRRLALLGQLPEIARLLSNGSSAGLSMAASLELAARELDDPAGAEVRRLVDEVRLGRSIEDSLEAFGSRLRSREASVLMTTLVIQQRVGGDVVRALREIADTLEARKSLNREVRTILSGSVFTSYVVAALGIGTVLLLDLIRPGTVDAMLGSPAGIAVFAVAGAMFAAGFVLIRRTTRIET